MAVQTPASSSTQKRVLVGNMWFNGMLYDADTSEDQCTAEYSSEEEGWRALSRVAILCNVASFKPGQGYLPVLRRECSGDLSDAALLKCCELSFRDVETYRDTYKKVAEIPFNSASEFQVSIHSPPENDEDKRYILVMKGAPERILEHSANMLINGQEISLSDKEKKLVNDAYLELCGQLERVIGFCDYRLPLDKFPPGFQFDTENVNFPLSGLRFVGLMGLVEL